MMKKTAFYIGGFALLIWALLTGPNFNAYGGTISIAPFISGNDVTINALETMRSTIQNWANGNVEGGTNIKAGSLVSQDFANSVSIVKFRDEAFSDFTYSGMLPATDSDLTSDISAGVSYVNGVRIENTAQSHTYTASRDTYVYIGAGGSYSFSEVALGASAPTTPANSLLLAKVITSGAAITTVTDLRTLSIQITATTSNFPMDYRVGAYVSRDSTTTFHVEPGSVAIGTTIYTTTADSSTKNIATGSNWIEGSFPSGTVTKMFIYAYNNTGSQFDFKFSSADPVYSDTSSNNGGILRYYTTGGVTYRAIGWGFLSADTVQSYEFSNFPDPGADSAVSRFSTTSTTVDDASYGADLNNAEINFYSSGRPVIISYQGSGTMSTGLNLDSIITVNGSQLSDSEVLQGGTGNVRSTALIPAYRGTFPQGVHRIKVQQKVNTGNFTAVNRTLTIRQEE